MTAHRAKSRSRAAGVRDRVQRLARVVLGWSAMTWAYHRKVCAPRHTFRPTTPSQRKRVPGPRWSPPTVQDTAIPS